jgi:hypothetical protein
MNQNHSPFSELITKNELQKRLRCSRFLVEDLTRQGVIPHFRLGYRSLRYDWLRVVEALRKLERNTEPVAVE